MMEKEPDNQNITNIRSTLFMESCFNILKKIITGLIMIEISEENWEMIQKQFRGKKENLSIE